MIALAELNALPAAAFVTTLAAIFEHSPWVAERVAADRPFGSVVALTVRMRAAVAAAAPDLQLALIRAHPKLGARGPQLQSLTSASQGEQRRAGLAACSDAEYAELLELNERYVAGFGFPFILAVRGHDPASIIASCRSRLDHTQTQERATALTQIGLIAGYRLADTVESAPAAEIAAMREQLRREAAAGGTGIGGLLREWMLGAHLSLLSERNGRPVGVLPVAPGPVPLLLGGQDDLLVGIALARDLRNHTQVATRALILDPDGRQNPSCTVLPSGQPGEQLKYLHERLTSSGNA